MKIVILDAYTANPGDLSWDALGQLGELTAYDRTAPGDVAARIAGAEIVLTNKTPVTAQVMAGAPALCYIGVLATGYNIVDVEAARARGITVTNIPAYSTEAVAQLVFAHLLEICHHVGHHSAAVHAGRWAASPDFAFWEYPLMELQGKTMGIIGYGRIGRAVGRIARAFGMNVVAAGTRHACPELVPLNELLRVSDVISLNCPLTPETRGLICSETLARMKDGVIIINTSRGPVVNEADLRAALLSGKVYAAGIDVASQEPIQPDNPLIGLDNCFITPHIAWAPYEARVRLIDIATDNVRAFLEGRAQNVVSG
ncbi:MAG: D-2-hydroxyacid dehydrogenase [Candidatus Fimadaptatus sp.]